MVRSFKLVGLVFMAVLALGAVSAASASATALIKFSKEGNFAGKNSGVSTLEVSNGDKVECTSGTTKGHTVSEELALALVLFEKCSTEGVECNSASAPKGEIHIPSLLILLGSDENPEIKMNPAVLLAPSSPVVFKCEVVGIGSTITVEGSVICLVKNVAPKIELKCEKGATPGSQKDPLFWDEHESGVENTLLSTATGVIKFTSLKSNQQGSALLEGEGTEIQILE